MNLRGLLVQSSKLFGISSVPTVQFPSHQFVWKVRSVHLGAWGPSASVQFSSGSVQSIEPPIVWKEQRDSSTSLQQKSQPAGASLVARVEGSCALLTVLAYLSGMWCVARVTQFQAKIVYKKFVEFACLIGSSASSFSSVQGTAAKSLRSVCSVQFIHFSSRTLPALVISL